MVQWWFFTAALRATQATDSYKYAFVKRDNKMHGNVDSAKSIKSSVLLCRRSRSSLLDLLIAGGAK